MPEAAISGSEFDETNSADGQSFRVVVLGAGMSGICAGVNLLREGTRDFVILEKANSVGGTWRENRYPGVACDVPSHLYSFSFELNPHWSHSYSSGGEIWDYCERTVDKYGLRGFIRFGTEVTDVRFRGGKWHVITKDGQKITSDVVISGLGGLHLPKYIPFEGRDHFAGPIFHTAEWRDDVDLNGKRVAIIGTGASAAQTLPGIVDKVADVTVFQRSAAWVFPRLAQDISEATRRRFNRFPLLMRAYRTFLWLMMDAVGTRSLKRGTWLSKRLKKAGLQHLETSVTDPVIRERLTPDYEPGCKRRVIADDYLTCFNRDHVHLVTDPIREIETAGIRDATGKLHEVDVIVEATGFRPFDISDYVNVEGLNGLKLKDAWGERVDSLRTMMVSGFPNFFMLLGPNSATGHTSALIMIESETKYVMKCLRWMEREGISHIDPDPQAVRAYNARLQKDIKPMVFSGGCNAWYTDGNDFNFTLWPYSALRFVIEQWRIHPEEFQTSREA